MQGVDPDHTDTLLNNLLKKGKQVQTKVINQPIVNSNLKIAMEPRINKKRNSAHLIGDV